MFLKTRRRVPEVPGQRSGSPVDAFLEYRACVPDIPWISPSRLAVRGPVKRVLLGRFRPRISRFAPHFNATALGVPLASAPRPGDPSLTVEALLAV